ncbi:hypothetical protein CJF41_00630 [Pseudomonas lundensis]|nr:hypothetical protein CJF41_00630 [Pseudomonas lundensis]
MENTIVNNPTKNKKLLNTTTILIESLSNQSTSRGTGFMFGIMLNAEDMIPLLITNKHVIENTHEIKIRLSTSNNNDNSEKNGIIEYTIKDGIDNLIFMHPDPLIDLAAINIACILQNIQDRDISGYGVMLAPQDLTTEEELSGLDLAEEVLMIGYPTGLYDEKHNLPIIRQGVIASDPGVDFNGQKHFLIDCACYPGSSGSPVFMKEKQHIRIDNGLMTVKQQRASLIGILYAGPLHTIKGAIISNGTRIESNVSVETRDVINLGYVIPSSVILDFKDLVLARAPREQVNFSSTHMPFEF